MSVSPLCFFSVFFYFLLIVSCLAVFDWKYRPSMDGPRYIILPDVVRISPSFLGWTAMMRTRGQFNGARLSFLFNEVPYLSPTQSYFLSTFGVQRVQILFAIVRESYETYEPYETP